MKHIPNILSIIRILLIPFFVWQMLSGHTYIAASILLVSGLTDTLDGTLARKFNWITPLGKVLDPAADKLTQVTVCIVLAIKLHTYWPFFVILLSKDFVMLIIGGYLLKKGVKLEGAKWFGKISTVLFYMTMILIIFIPSMPRWVTIILLTLTTACAVFSVLMYFPEFLKYRAEIKNSNS